MRSRFSWKNGECLLQIYNCRIYQSILAFLISKCGWQILNFCHPSAEVGNAYDYERPQILNYVFNYNIILPFKEIWILTPGLLLHHCSWETTIPPLFESKEHYRDTYNLNFTHSKYVDLLQHAGQYCSIEGEARVLQYCPKCCNKSKYFE